MAMLAALEALAVVEAGWREMEAGEVDTVMAAGGTSEAGATALSWQTSRGREV